MEHRPKGVPAPPNEVQVEAEVLSARPDPAAPQRWQLEIRVRSSEQIAGPNFAKPGQTYRATFNQPLPAHLTSAVDNPTDDAGAEPDGESGPPPPPDLESPATAAVVIDQTADENQPPGAIMRARCEYMGDEHGGLFHILSIEEQLQDYPGGEPDPV